MLADMSAELHVRIAVCRQGQRQSRHAEGVEMDRRTGRSTTGKQGYNQTDIQGMGGVGNAFARAEGGVQCPTTWPECLSGSSSKAIAWVRRIGMPG